MFKRFTMRPTDLAWLAGLLEGEGCFTGYTQRGGQFTAKVYVKMTDYDVVDRAAHLMGCKSVRPTKTKDGTKQAWETAIAGKKAGELMRSLQPHMGIRRQARIQELLDTPGTHTC